MHYIFPAENMATELQGAINVFLKENEWFTHLVREKVQENELRAHKKHVVQLSTSIEALKAFVGRLAMRLHVKTPFPLDPNRPLDRRQKTYLSVCQLWDALEPWQPVTVTHLTGVNTSERLRLYSAAAEKVIAATIQQLQLSPKVCRQLSVVLPKPPSGTGFDLDTCVEIVTAVVLDRIADQMAWTKKSPGHRPHTEQTLSTVFGLDFKSPMNPDDRVTDFLRFVMFPLEESIERWIQSAIPKKTWRLWTVRALGRDLCLEQGEDFRVLDWERRTASGEWEMPDAVTLVSHTTPSEKEESLSDVIATDLKKQFANTDPHWLYSLLRRQPMRHVPGAGVPKHKKEINVVVDPLPQYSFFLNRIEPEPEQLDHGSQDMVRTWKDLVGIGLLDRH